MALNPGFDEYLAVCAEHARLAASAAAVACDDPAAVLALGARVLALGAREPIALGPVWHWVDPQVRDEFTSQHARLGDDLRVLAELRESDPAGEDTALLAGWIGRRLRDHVDRDERTLYRPLARWIEASQGQSSGPGRGIGDRYDDGHTA